MTRRLIAAVVTLVLVAFGFAPDAIGQVPGSAPPATTTSTNGQDTSANTSEVTFDRGPIVGSDMTPHAPPPASALGEVSARPPVFVAAETATGAMGAGGFSNADLEASANAMDRNGLTRAGRALQKHGDRPGSVFPRSTGSAEARNAQGIDQVNAILNDPNRTVDVLNKVINIYGSNGAGVRYSVGGDFMGFLEP